MDYSAAYNKFFKKLQIPGQDSSQVFSRAVGGDFEEMGFLQLQLLKHAGLKKHHHVVDVGCGTGRLAVHLARSGQEQYTGYDVVEGFLDHAKMLCPNPGFTFQLIQGTSIPLTKHSVDFVCFFSVFTHLLHEDSYNYLLSSKEILKPGGKIVFSFLAFDEEEHWKLFDQMLQRTEASHHDQFVTLRQLEIWADKLNLKIDLLETGSTPYIPLERPVQLENGARFETLGSLGQGVCVLSNKPESVCNL